MTGGVVRRDGLREAVLALRNDLHREAFHRQNHAVICAAADTGECSCSGSLREKNDRARNRVGVCDGVLIALDAVPDVPPTEATHCANRVCYLRDRAVSEREGDGGNG